MSMINRHNYEEFFLLYADDELTRQQRTAVELFVQQNPDMAAELDTLLQLKLQPEENIVFPGKALLYKTADVEININNYEEFFFLYIDRELDEKAREKVEKFVLQHPQLQDEFTLLKQTVLQPEAITFGGKSSLYRKEEGKRVYPLFMRMAAAAAVIGIAVLGWWLYPAGDVKHPANNTVAIGTTPAKKTTPPATPPVTKVVTPPAQQVTQQAQNSTAVNSKKQQKAITVQPQQQKTIIAPQQPADNTGSIARLNNQKNVEATAPLDTSHLVITTNTGSNDNIAQATQPAKKIAPLDAGDQLIKLDEGGETKQDEVKTQVAYATPYTVPFKVINTDDEDRSMYIGSLELNKDKVKGFLKRAGRLFGGRNKKDTD
ncbi:MAG TPA: hypothetical protein VG738_23905 [Chitinophagaceae bacterium]|nr:hypothetical protein [Chitinophagaceae bacterium]